jgi:hypothetical protein
MYIASQLVSLRLLSCTTYSYIRYHLVHCSRKGHAELSY